MYDGFCIAAVPDPSPKFQLQPVTAPEVENPVAVNAVATPSQTVVVEKFVVTASTVT